MDERQITRADLVELLSASEARLKAEMVQLMATQKAELKAELAELKTELAELKTGLRTEMAELKTELQTNLTAQLAVTRQEILDITQEQVRDAQTEILKAFLPFREDVGIRFRALDLKVSNTEAELRARMDVMEKRLGEIEARLLLNPPAA